MPTTWILVADQARARLFSLASDQGDPTEIAAFTNPEGRMRAHDLERGRHPRVHERLGEASHAIDPRSTPQRKSATRFAAQLRSMLEHAWADHACDSLALIAPPRFLGALNAALGKELRPHVVLEVAKDLTLADARTIGAQLPEALRHRA